MNIPKEFEEQVLEMGLGEKCQHFLDHKTAKVLEKSGFGTKPEWNLRTKKRKPPIHEILKRPRSWATFYLENDLDVWDSFLAEPHYDLWVKHHLITGEIIQLDT